MSRTPAPLTAADRFELQDLLSRYAWTLDVDDPDGAAALFTEDGVFDGVGGYYEGREQVRRMAAASRAHDAPDLVQHWVANTLIKGDGAACTMRSMCFGPSMHEGRPAVAFVGIYLDRCTKVDGVWRFSYRRWRPWTGESPE